MHARRSLGKKSKDFDWGAAGFSEQTKVIPGTAKTDLDRTTLIAAEMHFRTLGFARGDGIQLLHGSESC
jgi:hypothetical protein